MLVADACNPCYLGGRDQEDCGSKPAQAIYIYNSQHKTASRVAPVVGPLPSTCGALSSGPSTAKKITDKIKIKAAGCAA
jgi:hypothetical protein